MLAKKPRMSSPTTQLTLPLHGRHVLEECEVTFFARVALSEDKAIKV